MIFNDEYNYKVTRAAGEQAWQAVVVYGDLRKVGLGETPEDAIYEAQAQIGQIAPPQQPETIVDE